MVLILIRCKHCKLIIDKTRKTYKYPIETCFGDALKINDISQKNVVIDDNVIYCRCKKQIGFVNANHKLFLLTNLNFY